MLLQAILFTSVLLALGFCLRALIPLFRLLYIPAAVIAGLYGFTLLFTATHFPRTTDTALALRTELASWPSTLIAVVFAALLLERSAPGGLTTALRRGTRSALVAWIIILGQLLIGLVVYALAVPRTVTPTFAQLLEVSWAGGHGTSSAMGAVYRTLNFPEGRDLAYFLATAGLLYGVLAGLVLVNLALRRGWTQFPRESLASQATLHPFSPREPTPIGTATTRPEIIDPLALQAILLALAFTLGLAFQQTFIFLAGELLADRAPATLASLQNIPLFLFTLLGGWSLRHILTLLRLTDLLDLPSLSRITGVAMEFLIVAALATLRIESLGTYFVPLLLLIVLGGAWSVFCLLWLSRKLLPTSHWFELGLLNWGFSTANTPQGFMLLRMVDPELKSGAAEDYAFAAPLSAPFVGGGLLTFALFPPLLQTLHPVVSATILLAAMAALFTTGIALSRRARTDA